VDEPPRVGAVLLQPATHEAQLPGVSDSHPDLVTPKRDISSTTCRVDTGAADGLIVCPATKPGRHCKADSGALSQLVEKPDELLVYFGFATAALAGELPLLEVPDLGPVHYWDRQSSGNLPPSQYHPVGPFGVWV